MGLLRRVANVVIWLAVCIPVLEAIVRWVLSLAFPLACTVWSLYPYQLRLAVAAVPAAALTVLLIFTASGWFVMRRMGQAAFTILGVMILTFVLFRLVAGDVAAANLGQKAAENQKVSWRHRYGYDRPTFLNYHRQLLLVDQTTGDRPLSVRDGPKSFATGALGLVLADKGSYPDVQSKGRLNVLAGRWLPGVGIPLGGAVLNDEMALSDLTDGKPILVKRRLAPPAETQPSASQPATEPVPSTAPASTMPPAPVSVAASSPATAASAPAPDAEEAAEKEAAAAAAELTAVPAPAVQFTLGDGARLTVSLDGAKTAGDLMRRVNEAPGNKGKLVAQVGPLGSWYNSQFCYHLYNSVTLEARSLKDNRQLGGIIRERAPASLALQVPTFAMEWLIGLALACLVAYYRGSLLDKLVVFLSVLGMCIPFLGFMILGQYLMFDVSAAHAYGVRYVTNLYVPILIMVVAGVGGQVRFYRTVILDETNRDYVRTALAKGLPLYSVLFKHVLKNCMLPILTSLILTIPFLMMGSLLVESYFGIPGLGDLMLTSINDRNEPIMSALVFLTAVIYVICLVLTDVCYAIFDPRIRLR